MKGAVKRLIRDEKGQMLILTLILLVVGGLIITPLLGLISTGLLTGQVYESKMHELYAADAGVEDGLWRLVNEGGGNITPGIPSQLADPVNNKQVEVTIDAAWLLKGLSDLGLPEDQPVVGDDSYANDHWTVTGAINIENTANYIIDITSNETNAENVTVSHIGVWLPPGYSYVENSTKINGVAIGEDPLVTDPTPPEGIPHKSGTVLIWDFDETSFGDLSNISPSTSGGCKPAEKFPPSVRLSFDYTNSGEIAAPEEPEELAIAKGFFSWILLGDGRIAWDAKCGVFHITSRAASNLTTEKGTTVETYTLRDFGRYATGTGGAASALQGDYIAIGNTLMTSCWQNDLTSGPPCSYVCDYECRNYKVNESWATVNEGAVPSDARIEKAYLYWSAWWRTNDADKDVTLTVARDDGTGGTMSVTASKGYVIVDPSVGYEYSCFADVTDEVKAITTEVSGTTFTVSDVDAVAAKACNGVDLANQSSYAGWSMIIIYSSKQKEARLFYLYDDLAYLWKAYAEFTITGFEAPQGDNEAKLTVFAGEGDNWYQLWADSLQFKGQHSSQYEDLWDVSNTKYVFNSMSNTEGFTASQIAGQPSDQISGVDIDTYTSTRPTGGTPLSSIVQPGDTTAKIKASSTGDGFMLIYMIFSVRSTNVPEGSGFQIGTMTYEIK